MNYGYMRVSTKDQNEELQRLALLQAGVPKRSIVLDKQSGKDFNRPGYLRLCKKLKPGDTLFIKSIDRLGRNYNEILEQWRYLTKEKQIAIVVLDMPLLDTRKGRDLTGELIADIVLQLLSYVAQTERDFIRSRQAEGIAIAKAKGVHFGKKPHPIPPEFESVYHQWQNGTLSARKAGKALGVRHQTFLKWARTQTKTPWLQKWSFISTKIRKQSCKFWFILLLYWYRAVRFLFRLPRGHKTLQF